MKTEAREAVLSIIARQGFVYRADLASDEQRAAARLVREGRLYQRDENMNEPFAKGPGSRVIYYDPHWVAPEYTGPRLVRD
jgi:hypothetical protein